MLERCHRGNVSKNYKGSGPRPIFAAFYDWNDSEYVKEEFRENNISDSSCHIYAEQKYSALTTKRRNLAMLHRKKLKAEGNISNGYIAFPAKLMVKKKVTDKKYYLEKDFSKAEVHIPYE